MAVKRINAAEAKRFMEERPDCLVLDVREEEEFILGHIDGALLFTLDEIDAETAEATIPAKDTPVLLCCKSGKRSRQAAEKLAALGYTQVYDLGSLRAWPYGFVWD